MKTFNGWKEYRDESGSVVGIMSPSGNESRLLIDSEVAEWLAAGGVPEHSDPMPLPDYSVMRKAAYLEESDPLFFKEQRGEIPEGSWLAKVSEIKARWPE